jgi:hypothetical protein
MVYVINNYSGNILVSVNDRTVNNTATSIRLPGRDYRPYGEVIVENLVWMLQHFSGANPPLQAIPGQIWYDSNNQEIKVYNGVTWLNTGKIITSSEFPATAQSGQTFYHTTKKQLYVRDINQTWKLVGPMGATDNTDPAPDPQIAHTDHQVFTVTDTLSGTHKVIRLSVGGATVAVWSGDDEFTLSAPIPGFAPTVITRGLNLNTASIINGNSLTATTATNATNLGNQPAGNYMRRDQSNVPAETNLDLGSISNPYANMYAVNFNGTASFATVAANAQTADLADDSLLLEGSNKAYFDDQIAAKVSQSGDSMTGKLTINSATDSALVAYGAVEHAIRGYAQTANKGGVIGFSASGSQYGILGHNNMNSFYGVGALYNDGTITASQNITAFSDERLKENIQQIEDALHIVQSLMGVRYTHKHTQQSQVGVVAQQVQQVLPEVVQQHADGMLSVAYGNLTAVLIEAVKELAERVARLEAGTR